MTRVGIVGTGGIAAVHANQYRKRADVELFAYDTAAEKLAAFCERFEVRPAASLDDLLSRSDVADLCLPTDAHLPVALAAISAGRGVLVEKPMAGSVRDCAAMIDAAERANVPLMPAQVVRWFPAYRAAHELVASGAIGTPAVARTRRGGRYPLGDGGWFRDVERSGGVLMDVGVHDFDWQRWTLGEVVDVRARSVLVGDATAGGDYGLAVLRFESGAIGHVEATWMDPGGFRTTLEVAGSGGLVRHDSREGGSLIRATGDGVAREEPLVPHDDPYFRQISSFLAAVTAGGAMPVSAHDGLMAVSLCEAALTSARSGKAVRPSRG